MKKSFCLSVLGLVITGSLFLMLAPGLKADEASHYKAAQDFLVAAQMKDIFTKAIDQALDMQVKQSPQLAEYREVMKAFFDKYMSWDALKDDMAKLYEDSFSEQELKDLAKFYQTPTGKKLALTMPDLMSKEAQLGQEKVQEHIGELQQMIQEAMQKKGAQDSQSGTSAPSAPGGQ